MTTTVRLSASPSTTDSKAQERLRMPLGSRTYAAQYAPLYDARLRMLRGRLRHAAQRNWSARERIDPDVDPDGAALEEDELDAMDMEVPHLAPKVVGLRSGQTSVIIGVVYTEPPSKPNVLSELARELSLPPQPIVPTYTNNNEGGDVFIEDESGRVQLVGPAMGPPPGGMGLRYSLVTGAVLGALGRENKNGQFVVQDLIYPDGSTGDVPRDLPHQPEAHESTFDGPEWIAVVAGLAEGAFKPDEPDALGNTSVRRQLLAEWLAGELGSFDDRNAASKVVRLVVAGDSLAPVREQSTSVEYGDKTSPETIESRRSALKELDSFLSELTSSMPVHIQPGSSDPVPGLLPQQPIHQALLPQSSRFSGLVRETNPAWVTLPPLGDSKETKTLLSGAGETVRDVRKYWATPWTSALRAAVLTLRWHHVAPTAPDTLWCVPITGADPFTIETWPDIYVLGGQPSFATTTIQHPETKKTTRVVLLASFAHTGQVALVNLASLRVKSVTIGMDL